MTFHSTQLEFRQKFRKMRLIDLRVKLRTRWNHVSSLFWVIAGIYCLSVKLQQKLYIESHTEIFCMESHEGKRLYFNTNSRTKFLRELTVILLRSLALVCLFSMPVLSWQLITRFHGFCLLLWSLILSLLFLFCRARYKQPKKYAVHNMTRWNWHK